MDYADRFIHKAFTAEVSRRRSIARQETVGLKPSPSDLRIARRREFVERARLAVELKARIRAFLGRFREDSPEDPYAYSLVRVNPRLPQLSRGATAELDD